MRLTDIKVHTYKAVFQQRCIDAARIHTRYLSGSVRVDAVQGFHEKMARKYDLNLPDDTACRRRRAGGATCRLIFYKQPENYYVEQDSLGLNLPNDYVSWILFASDGKHPIGDAADCWLTLTGDVRLELLGMEMVRRARPGKAAPAWTWRLTDERYNQLRNNAITAIKTHTDVLLAEVIRVIAATPGFHDARAQARKIRDLIKGEWQRHRKDGQMPKLPSRIGFVRRTGRGVVTLETCLKTARKARANHAKRVQGMLDEAGERE